MAINTNQIRIQGTLVRKNVIAGVSGKGKEYLMADLTLRLDGNREVTVSLFANKLNSTGQVSKLYTNLETINEEYKSLNSTYVDKRVNKDAKPTTVEATTVSSEEECDFIIVNKGATISMNRYLGQDGQIAENFRVSANFVNRAKPEQPREPMIEGNLVGIVTSGVNHGEDAIGEYIKLELTVPQYREAYGDNPEKIVVDKFPLVLRDLTDEAIAYVEDNFELNSVVSAVVEPTHKIVKEEVQTETPRGFGKVFKTEPQTRVLREINLVGGFALEEDMYAEEKAFDYDLYEKALKDFDEKIESLKADKVEVKEVKRGFGKTASNSDLPF